MLPNQHWVSCGECINETLLKCYVGNSENLIPFIRKPKYKFEANPTKLSTREALITHWTFARKPIGYAVPKAGKGSFLEWTVSR